jgi:hypothetical protein
MLTSLLLILFHGFSELIVTMKCQMFRKICSYWSDAWLWVSCWACKSTQKRWVLPVLWCLLQSLSSGFEFLQVQCPKVLLRDAYWWHGANESVLQLQEAFENSHFIPSSWTSLLVAQIWGFCSSSKETFPLQQMVHYVSSFHTTDCVAQHDCVQIVGAFLPCVSQVEEMVELLCICRTMEVSSAFLYKSAPKLIGSHCFCNHYRDLQVYHQTHDNQVEGSTSENSFSRWIMAYKQ